jgi:hypothetical protein
MADASRPVFMIAFAVFTRIALNGVLPAPIISYSRRGRGVVLRPEHPARCVPACREYARDAHGL